MLPLIDCIKAPAGEILRSYRPDITDNENFSLWIGSSPLLLQAHVDTIHPPKDVKMGKFIITGDGLGADDRAGVYACMQLKKKYPQISVLLTNHEETGGIGMENMIKHLDGKAEDIFSHINLAIAVDREGCGHFVTYNTLPKEVEIYANMFGWWKDWGTFSDIELFSDEYGIPSINVSCGFHEQHTKHEYLVRDELDLCIRRLEAMINNPINKRYDIPIHEDKYAYYRQDYKYDDYKDPLEKYGTMPCPACKSWDTAIWDNVGYCYNCDSDFMIDEIHDMAYKKENDSYEIRF